MYLQQQLIQNDRIGMHQPLIHQQQTVLPSYNLATSGSLSSLSQAYGGFFYQMSRKDRVKRYLDKKKRRKYDKRVRYASRKAYAEIRPRVGGRFVKAEKIKINEVEDIDDDGHGDQFEDEGNDDKDLGIYSDRDSYGGGNGGGGIVAD